MNSVFLKFTNIIIRFLNRILQIGSDYAIEKPNSFNLKL